MDNVFNLGKKAFAVAVATATILWSVGLAAFAVPTASAAASMGDLIKGTSLTTVYFYGYDGMRYTFPNEKIYMSWYSNFSGVETISDSDLADIDLAGNVMVRPGTYWIKITSMDDTYAVSTNGTIMHIASEDVATDYAGSNWNTGIIDMPDAFFVDYTTGAPLTSAEAFDGMLYMDGGDYYLAWGGDKRLVSDDGMTANNFQSKFFLDGSGIDDSSLNAGDDITTEISAVTDAAQTGGNGDVTGGNLEVSLASSTPASMSVPNSASSVEVATFKMKADEATTLSSLTVSLSGLVDEDVFASNGVYLYEGDMRLVDGRSVNSSTRTVTFAGINMDFSAGETRYVSVVVDMDDSTVNSGSFAWTIDSADDVGTDGDVSGSFPVEGSTMTVEDIVVGSLTVTDTGSITNPTLGEQGAEIGKFKLQAGSSEDVSVERITLKIDDAADHSDYVLWNGSDEVATGEYIGDKLVLFSFDTPFEIQSGNNENFTVSATIGGQTDDTIDVYLDNSADLYAVGSDYGFGVTVTSTGYDGTAGNVSSSTIQGGELTVVFNGPSASDVKDGAEDADLFEFSMTAERWMEVQGVTFNISGTDLEDTDPALTDVKIVNADTGALVAGPEEMDTSGADDNDLPVAFTDNFSIEAGETLDLMLTADVDQDVAAANDTYTATLDISTLDVEDDSGDTVTDVVPSSDLAGYAQTVRTAGLTVSLASTPTSQSYVKGSSSVSVVGYNLTAANGSDLTLTDLTVTTYVDEDGEGTYVAGAEDGSDGDSTTTAASDRINSCSLYDASSTRIAGPESVETDGSIIFENMSFDIAAGDTERVTLQCNLANVDPGTSDKFAFEVDAATDVEAEDDEGDALASSDISASAVNGSETVVLTITSAGSMTVTAASDAPDSDLIMTGSTSNTVSKFRFDAAREAFTINRLTVTEEQAETMDGTTDSSAYANNVDSVTISYPKADGTTGTATGSLTGNEVTFNSLSFYVPKDDHAEVTVKVNVATSDRHSGSATSNEMIRMGLSSDTSADDQFRAVGASSGTTIDDDDVTPTHSSAANTSQGTFVVRETKPTVSLSSSTPSGSDKVPGDQEVFRFNVAANSGEDVVLDSVLFRIATTDNGGDGTDDWNMCDTDNPAGVTVTGDFDLYNLSTTGTTTAIDGSSDWTLLTSDGAACTSTGADLAYARLALTSPEVIPAGSTYSYALYFDTTGASSSADDSVQVSIDGDPALSSYITASALNENNLTATDTTLTVAASSTYVNGDVLCMDTADDNCGSSDERMLLVSGGGTTSLVVVRGYMGTSPDTTSANDTNDDIDRIPGTFLWEDDGNASDTTTYQELWGSYLVDNLAVTGNAIGF